MNHVEFKPDLSEWDLEFTESFTKLKNEFFGQLNEVVEKVVMYALNSEDTYAYLPIGWYPKDCIGGNSEMNPLTIYVRFCLNNRYSEFPTFSCDLRTMIEEVIDGHISPKIGKVSDKNGITILKRMSKELNDLRILIDSHIGE